MTFYYYAVLNNLHQQRRNLGHLLLWPVLLLSLMFLLGLVAENFEIKAHLIIADQEKSASSQLFIHLLEEQEQLNWLEIERFKEIDTYQAKQHLLNSEASALLVIPIGFEAAILKEKSLSLDFFINPSHRVLPEVLKEGFQSFAKMIFYLHHLYGSEIRQLVDKKNIENLNNQQFQLHLQQQLNLILKDIFPLLLDIDTPYKSETHQISYSVFIFSALLMLAFLFSIQELSETWWQEKELKTLKRFATTPQAFSLFLLAKLSSSILFLGFLFSILLGIGFYFHQISMFRFPLALLWLIINGLIFYLLFSFFQLSIKKQKSAKIFISLLVFISIILAGSFLPIEFMPEGMRVIGAWMPSSYIFEQLRVILFSEQTVFSLIINLLVSSLILGTFFLIFKHYYQTEFINKE